ncbi:MBOAT family protein [Rhodoferax sp.]|uniref:MBOAT family O-acyltransferase n=1 Tax=Rhodoferax sp. TaxID=50421 RepID=UPI00284D7C20|nr:MBOAT family protein [Rhodoferax sp.]MDR3369921.1 MBOAT family protein [Rhodoferax sp.]
MLFNSTEFLFAFLPVLLIVFFQLGRVSQRLAAAWLALGSLFFYAWWNPAYVVLLLGSIVFNYLAGYALARGSDIGSPRRKRLLVMGVTGDLVLLGYFKYANFFVDTVNTALGTSYGVINIVLPLGISFFTFTQIAFLVDAARGKAKEFNFIHYGLFVTYFPHLIAGPVLHHKEMMPQFGQPSTYRFNYTFLTVGLTMFALGLFKKVVLADGVAPYATPIFAAAAQGDPVGLLQAWGGALAYTLQLYFDFSGYSDMAIGLSYMIGVRLPLNFNSPYKATSITEFWRRWHMTLSRFLRDYLYISLGGNRQGPTRRYVNLMATMLLGGLWHGAGWTFVIWGGLHGLALVLHQAWRGLRKRLGHDLTRSTALGHVASVGLTFLVVVLGWVFFRAASFSAAIALVHGMFGLNGVSLPDVIGLRLGNLGTWLSNHGVAMTPGGGRNFAMTFVWIGALLPVVFLAPNTQQIMHHYQPALVQIETSAPTHIAWQINLRWAMAMALVLGCGLLSLSRPSEFLYFQF